MKIAVVAPSIIPSRKANSVQIMKMAQAFQSAGNEVQVISPADRIKSHQSDGDLPVTPEGLSHHYGLQTTIPIEQLPSGFRLRGYDYAVRAIRWAHRWGADLIYTRLPQAAGIASQFAVPVIFEIHDLPPSRAAVSLLRRFYYGRGARRLVVITAALAKDLQIWLNPPRENLQMLIAPDGVDLSRYQDLPHPDEARHILASRALHPFDIPCGQLTAGYTGHLYSGRGTQLILNLAERFPEISFLIAGGEPQEVAKLRRESQARGLKNVLLSGFIPNAELPLYQAACDLLLMPYQQQVAASSGGDISRYLSPMKMFEYLAAGRLILSSNLPVLQEVLNPGNAILLPPDDVHAWIDALSNVSEHLDGFTRLGIQARQDAAGYTWEGRVQKILQDL